MLILSNKTITLVNSRDFIRAIVLIYCFTGYIVYQSGFVLWLKLGLFFLLLRQVLMLIANPRESRAFHKLSFKPGQCILEEKNGGISTFDKAYVTVEAGICFVLELSNAGAETRRLVFFDQIGEGDFRIIKLFEKMTLSIPRGRKM